LLSDQLFHVFILIDSKLKLARIFDLIRSEELRKNEAAIRLFTKTVEVVTASE
jgi:hypothetical protein